MTVALQPLGEFVDNRLTYLQEGYLTGRTSAATATLARLRGAVGKPPGSEPAIWELTLDGLPETGWRAADDEPSRNEFAAHAAMTLYAVHQQARSDRMHVRGHTLGGAVRSLARPVEGSADREKAVRRRFDAVATATAFDEVVYHLRGLVTQLRGAGISLDYGRLADDLARLQEPTQVSDVRRRWGRDYYRTTADESAPTNDVTNDASDTTDITDDSGEQLL